MRVLVAFDKFKDSLSAAQACAAAARALAAARPDWQVDECPLTDGGEGFQALLTRASAGSELRVRVTGPRGGTADAAVGLVSIDSIPKRAREMLGAGPARSAVAVVEMAAASGLALLEARARDPFEASSAGTGELIAAAADAGAGTILLGIGGSATHDLGCGALAALGVSFVDGNGAAVFPPRPSAWPRVAGVRGRLRAGLPPIRIACDVENPLLGPRGAAAVYGRQKGLQAADEPGLEEQTARLAGMLCRHFGAAAELADVPGAGAAGGISFGLMAAAGARLLPGLELVAAWLDLDARLALADLVVTGEGRFDASSLSGKGPGALVKRALAAGKAVHVFAGSVEAAAAGPAVHAISPAGLGFEEALRAAPELLFEAVRTEFSA